MGKLTTMEWLFALFATICAGLVGYAAAWLRVDLDMRPTTTCVGAAAIAGFGALFWLLERGEGPMLVLFAALGPLVWIDWSRKLLPDAITIPLIAVGLALAVGQGRGVDAALGAALGYLAFRGLGWAWETARGVDALGRGDAKLFAAIGAFLGWAALPEVAFVAATIGIVVALIAKKITGDEEIPFGPALAAGALIVWAEGPILTF